MKPQMSAAARKKIDAGVPMPSPTAKAASVGVTRFVCCKCGTVYQNLEHNFPASNSPVFAGNFGRLPICNKCFNESVFEALAFYGGDIRKAFRRVAMQWDIYYSDELGDVLEARDKKVKRFTQYITLKTTGNDAKTYSDFLLEHEAEKVLSDPARSVENSSPEEEFDGDCDECVDGDDLEVNQRIWGDGLKPSDYDYLNYQYSTWESKYDLDTLARQSYVRDLCKIQLLKDMAMRTGDQDSFSSFADLYQKTLDRADMSPKKESAAAARTAEEPMGVWIKRFEQERPIPEPDPEWGDVDGIMKIVLVFFIGHLCHMIGWKNRYARMYEEELRKYSPPDMPEDTDSEDVFDRLLEDGFAAGGVKLTGGDIIGPEAEEEQDRTDS